MKIKSSDIRLLLDGKLYSIHSGILIQLHIRRNKQKSIQLEQQYKDIGSHETYCSCYFCNPQI